MAITPHSLIRQFLLINPVKDGLPPPPDGYVTIDATYPVFQWLEQQPLSEWKFDDVPAYSGHCDRFIISEQLYTLLVLRWS